MILLCFIAGLFALMHFIFESIIAPSARFNITLDLFALRDKARRLKAHHPEIGDDAFNAVQDGINIGIKYLYDIDYMVLIHCEAMLKNNPQLRERVEKRKAIVRAANSPELMDIAMHLRKKVELAATFNNGGWSLYIVPIALALLACKSVLKSVFSIVYVPVHEVDKLFPSKDLELVPA